MLKLFAAFASVLLVINLSSCSMPNEEKTEASVTVKSAPEAGTQSMTIKVAQEKESEAVSSSAPTPASSTETNKVIDSENISIIPQQDNKIIITYPKYEINQYSDIQPNDQNYTLTLIPGNYSDPQNAISTFLYDLYMKQSVCFDNIHRDIRIDSSNQDFVDTLYTLESLIPNLGQIDVLVLPQLKYNDCGVPYIFQTAAAYKTTEDRVIHFGNTCDNQEFKQITKGQFDTSSAKLNFESDTIMPDNQIHTTYFEAIRTKRDEFVYCVFNFYNDNIQSIRVSLNNIWMEAGFSKGKLPENFNLASFSKITSSEETDKLFNLKPVLSLYANEDGAMIPSEETALKKKFTE